MAPLPTLGSEVSLVTIALLNLLEKVTGWVYCHFCHHLGSQCTCMGALPPSWSQVVGESPGCKVTASSGGVTTPGTPAAGMPRCLLPPPGLPPIDYSKWRLPPPEAPAARRATAPLLLPGVRRSAGLWGMAKRIAGVPLGWTGPVNASTAHDGTVHAPDGACLTTTPYQQGVQPPKMPAGRGATADTPTDKTTPMGGTTQD